MESLEEQLNNSLKNYEEQARIDIENNKKYLEEKIESAKAELRTSAHAENLKDLAEVEEKVRDGIDRAIKKYNDEIERISKMQEGFLKDQFVKNAKTDYEMITRRWNKTLEDFISTIGGK